MCLFADSLHLSSSQWHTPGSGCGTHRAIMDHLLYSLKKKRKRLQRAVQCGATFLSCQIPFYRLALFFVVFILRSVPFFPLHSRATSVSEMSWRVCSWSFYHHHHHYHQVFIVCETYSSQQAGVNTNRAMLSLGSYLVRISLVWE